VNSFKGCQLHGNLLPVVFILKQWLIACIWDLYKSCVKVSARSSINSLHIGAYMVAAGRTDLSRSSAPHLQIYSGGTACFSFIETLCPALGCVPTFLLITKMIRGKESGVKVSARSSINSLHIGY
jgi:hypothetical protein